MMVNPILLYNCALFFMCQHQREPISFLRARDFPPRTCCGLLHVSGVFGGSVMLHLRGVNLETPAVLASSECLCLELWENTLFPFWRHHKLMTMESRWQSGALNWSESSWRGKRLMIATHPSHLTGSRAVELTCGLSVLLYMQSRRNIHPSAVNSHLGLIRDMLGAGVCPSSWLLGGRQTPWTGHQFPSTHTHTRQHHTDLKEHHTMT